MAQTADSENMSGFYQGAATSLVLSTNLLRRMMTDKGAEESKGEREDEMELNLGLSLGGCHVKTEKDKARSVNLQLDLHRKDMNCDGGVGLQRDGYGHGEFRLQKKDDGGVDFGFGLQKNDDGCADFCFGLKQEGLRQEEVPGIHDPPRPLSQQQQQEMFTSQQTPQQEMLEQQKKRELHALRRQEARKKREEKQLQKARREAAGGMRSIQPNKAGKNQNGFIPLVPSYAAPFPMRGGTVFPPMTRAPNVPFEEEKRVLGAQMSSIRAKHRTAKENEPCRSDRKEKVYKISNQWDKSSNGGGDPPISNKVSVMPITYPFPVLATSPQCMPMHMAYSYPYIMPFWPAEASKSSIANPSLSPIPTRPFPPFQTAVSGALQTSWFADLQKCPGTGPPHSSHASSGRSSSAVSDNETRSCRGICSNESSASASSAMETLQRVSSASKTAASSEVSSASQIETPKFPEVVAGGGGGGENSAAQSALATSTTTTITEASHSKDEQNQSWLPTKTCKDNEAHFANMPCVSTSGDGGKTINGFLCRYRGGEVSIVCVCHGIFLSPAEFMQHAGRTDVSHPERHILVNVQCNQ